MSRSDFGYWYRKRAERAERAQQRALEQESRVRLRALEQENRIQLRALEQENREILRALEKEDRRLRCVSSTQCGAGYGCVNGKCVVIGATGGNGSPNSPGNCPSNSNLCGQGSNTCQSSPTCGSGSPLSGCCGGTINYVFEPGEEARVEGECVANQTCHYYCSSQYALFGPPNTDPESGLTDHCAGKSICTNTDCEECGLFSGICEPKFGDRPCWCNGGRSCGYCEACITNPDDSNFGSCAPTEDSLNRCRQCVTLESYKCCGQEIGPLTVCSTKGFGGTTNDLRDELKRQAQAKCSEFCDSCEQKTYKSYCTDTTGLPDPDTLNCPEGLRCKQTGSMTIGGELKCVYVEEVDNSNCDFKPGKWEFNGMQTFHTNIDGTLNGEVAWRPVYAYFIQGDPSDPSSPKSGDSLRNCADGGCYPVMYAPTGFGSSFSPTGSQSPWGESLTVEALGDPVVGGGGCTGGTSACGISILTSQGEALTCNFSNKCTNGPSTDCGCIRKTYYPNGFPTPPAVTEAHFGPGCTIQGTWTYVG